MSLNTIRAAIEGRIATEFAESPALQVAYDNAPFAPPNNASFIQARIDFGASSYVTILKLGSSNGGRDRRNGALTLDVFSPVGQGPGAGLTIAQRCIDLFNRVKLNDIIFDAASGPRTIELARPEGYYQTQVAITFEAYEES